MEGCPGPVLGWPHGLGREPFAVMRACAAAVLTYTLLACAEHTASPSPAPSEASPTVADVETFADDLVKRVPADAGPTLDVNTPALCEKAGGVWAESYVLGMLIIDRPEDGAMPMGPRCWPKHPLTRLADADQACSGQNDCIGNCIAQQDRDGTWSPRCQIHAEDPVCGPILYEGGEYRTVRCPVP